MAEKYDSERIKYVFQVNSGMGIPEEQTALAIAKSYGKEEEMVEVLQQRKKSLPDLLEQICFLRAGTPGTANAPKVINAGDYIELENLVCTDADGNVFEKYDKLLVSKDIFRDQKGARIDFTPYNAAVYCKRKGLFLPSFALSCNIIVGALFQNRKDVEINKLLLQYKDYDVGGGWHGQNNVINYETEEVIHYPSAADFNQTKEVNTGCRRTALKFAKATLHDCWLEEALRNKAHTRFIRQLTGLRDPSVLVEIGQYFGRPARLRFPWSGRNGTSYNNKQTAWLGCSYNYFVLDAYVNLNVDGVVRGVRLNAPAAGARAVKMRGKCMKKEN